MVALRRAAERPLHAYLLVGPRGSGVEDAARIFAAALVAGESDTRAVDLALRGMHPDVVEYEPEGGATGSRKMCVRESFGRRHAPRWRVTAR